MERIFSSIRPFGPFVQSSSTDSKQETIEIIDEAIKEFNLNEQQSNGVKNVAYDMVGLIFGTTFTSGKKNQTLAGSCLYSALLVTGADGEDVIGKTSYTLIAKEYNITQEDVGSAVGVSQTTIRKWYDYVITSYHLSKGYTSEDMYGRPDFDEQLKNDFKDLYTKSAKQGGLL